MKKPWQSKTLILNFLIAAVALLVPGGDEYIKEHPQLTVITGALVNFILRLLTKEPIAVKQKNKIFHRLSMMLFPLCLFGCASADIKIPADQYPSPLDTNYKTVAFRVTCDGVERRETDFGMSGCSIPWESELSNSSVTIASPFPASVSVNSHETGFHKRYILEPRIPRVFSLAELIPIQTEFATYSFYIQWQKPESLNIETPVRGQEGTFIFRLAPQDSERALLSWSPVESPPENIGLAYSQFRAKTTHDESGVDEIREPIRLTITTTETVGDGRYQLYNSELGIGVPTTPFAGDEILIPRHAITGPAQVGNYTLFGWARTKDVETVTLLELDNDFVVGVSLYRYDTAKLAAELHFTEDEVCYLTEAAVFLIADTASNTAQNAPDDGKGCFPIPETTSEIFFMTNVGRAAVAWVDGPNRVWKLKN